MTPATKYLSTNEDTSMVPGPADDKDQHHKLQIFSIQMTSAQVQAANSLYDRIYHSIFGRKSGFLINLVRIAILSAFFVWWSKTPASVSTVTIAPTTAFHNCLNSVCGGAEGCVRYSGIGKDEDFHQWVTPYNRAWPWIPAAVVRPQNTEGVSGFVKCAADNHIKVQAKSGGHSYANHGLGGQHGSLSIDLQDFRYVNVNESSWVATIGAGSTLGGVDAVLEEHGRMFPHGLCPGIGMGGHAIIGGLGPSSRMWGATLDHVLEVKMVVADGSIVIANKTSNEDLFFAVRGGGSGFGIITEFKMRTHEAPRTVLRVTSRTPYTQSSLIVDQFLSWQSLTADPNLDPRFGTEYTLEPSGSKITGTWFGTKEEFEMSGILENLPSGLTIIESTWDETARWAWENAELHLANAPSEFFSRSLGFREDNVLSREAAIELVDMVRANNDRLDTKWFVIFDATGGEVAKPAMNSTAYAHRDKVRFVQSYGYSLQGALSGPKMDRLKSMHQFIVDNTFGGPNTTYAGYADPYLETPQEAYWGSNLPRLQEIKLARDPNDVFHNPQTVRPTT